MRDVGRGEQSGFARVGELVARLNAISRGLTYSIDADGLLQVTPIEGAALSEFDRQMQTYINDPATIPMRFTNRHGLTRDPAGHFTRRVFIDEFSSGYVDIDDLLASSDVSLETSLVHLLRERQATRDYARRLGTPGLDPDRPGPAVEFGFKHRAGLAAELPVVRDYFGDDKIVFVGDPNNRTYRSSRGDILREHVEEGRGAAGAGIDALSIQVTLHESGRVISAEAYRDLLEAERTRQRLERERGAGPPAP